MPHPETAPLETLCLLETLLEAGFRGAVPVTDGAMHPAVQAGDGVIATPFLGLPQPGQIVLARRDETLLVRRLVGIKMRHGRRRYLLRSDSAREPVAALLREDLLGRVVAVVRQGMHRPLDDAGVIPPRARGASNRQRGRRRTLRS